ncbi:MAG: 50S ribosomal protein L11 [Thermoplasmata archaeon]|nr:MAG: 50S ribosomal protein L11 [Thermoplasmata archaeon]HDO69135.1 50S ribosomal protein L11 [Thermoplasmatales archaeon]HEX17050.1 50S ribosomal protein L11 [Thermoplasmatales archaeon]
MVETIEVLVEGGKATAGPPLGPALGPLGVNVMQVVNAINEKTKHFEGMKVPVKVMVDPKTKSFEIEVGTPPVTALILKELGIEKGSGNPRENKVGNLTMDQVVKIARMKHGDLLGKDLKRKVKEVIGSCVSMGVTVEGKSPKEVQREIDEGKYDSKFS